MPQDAQGEAARRVLQRFQRSVRCAGGFQQARSERAEALVVMRLHVVAVAQDRRQARPADHRHVVLREHARAPRDAAPSRRDPGRAARGRRPARRSTPASRGRSPASARPAPAPPASAPARSRPARESRPPVSGCASAEYSSGIEIRAAGKHQPVDEIQRLRRATNRAGPTPERHRPRTPPARSPPARVPPPCSTHPTPPARGTS